MKNITSTLRRKLILSTLVTVSLSLGTSMTSCSDWLEMEAYTSDDIETTFSMRLELINLYKVVTVD